MVPTQNCDAHGWGEQNEEASVNKKLKRKWVAALHGGYGQQCTPELNGGGNSRCALGVLGEVIGVEWEWDAELESYTIKDPEKRLVDLLRKRAALSYYDYCQITKLSDEEKAFFLSDCGLHRSASLSGFSVRRSRPSPFSRHRT
jgi:hypothetical protein